MANDVTSQNESMRSILFLSHATPEDNAFVKWLASQLTIAGYQVWCDVTALMGGEPFWKNIEEAIDQVTFRFLFVSTLEANRKLGTLRELHLAQVAQKQHGLNDFIVPLKIDEFPFDGMQKSIQNLNVIRFDLGWAQGFRQLLKLLEREIAPKSDSSNASAVLNWYTQSLKNNQKLVRYKDQHLSNWFNLELPKRLYAHSYRGPSEALSKVACALSFPHRVVGQRLYSFASTHAVTMALGEVWINDDIEVLDTGKFVLEGSTSLDIVSFDASNLVTDLVRQTWDSEMTRQKLCEFQLASGLVARFFKEGQLEKNKAFFTPTHGRRTWRQLVGSKSRKTAEGKKTADGFWHYAISSSPQLTPFPRLVLRHHVVFTDDGEKPWKNAD